MDKPVDIAIIGSGIACTATLIEIYRHLLASQLPQKLSITVIEKHQEFWKGVPYGSRSSPNSLTITSIKDFFRSDEESNEFFSWFKPKQDELIADYRQKGGFAAEQWLQDNLDALRKEDWDHVYLPRYIVGIYIEEKLAELRQLTEGKQFAALNLITGEATEVFKADDCFNIEVELANGSTTVQAKKIVVAIGSSPERKLTDRFDDPDSPVIYINNPYQPSFEDNLARIEAELKGLKNFDERNILVVGSNASSIELLYLINNNIKLKEQINRIVLLSTGGKLPYHILYDDSNEPCVNLEEIKLKAHYTLEELIDAAIRDIKPTANGQICIPYIDRVVGLTLNLLQPLGEEAMKRFYGIHGTQLARLFRRSGMDYKKASECLLQSGKLKLEKGGFVDLRQMGDLALLKYKDTGTREVQEYQLPFKVIINCSGSDDLQNSSSKLIRSLIEKHNCKVNLSNKAFEVNEKFEAASGIYVIGPLIGGNMNKLIHFWHLENASRIMYLAPFLAKELLNV